MATSSASSAATLRISTISSSAKLPTTSFLPLRNRLPLKTLTLHRRTSGGGAAGARMADTAASSYATALADVAKDNGTLDATIADVEKIERFFANPGVQSFYLNPTIPKEKKMEMIQEIGKAEEMTPHMVNFLSILVDMGRIDIIKDIVMEFEVIYNQRTGTEVAVVSSVVKLESEQLAQIAKHVQRLTGAKNVRIKTVIDPSLVAGFTIRYGSSGSKLIDMSVKKQLTEIASQLDFSAITLA